MSMPKSEPRAAGKAVADRMRLLPHEADTSHQLPRYQD